MSEPVEARDPTEGPTVSETSEAGDPLEGSAP